MQQQGLKLALISGDSQTTTDAVGHKLGLFDCHGDMLPEEKADFIKARRKQGACVAMVGDGINDAPVLARADVGVAMGGLGSDAAVETADVVLMNDSPMKMTEAVAIARQTRRIVWQNITFKNRIFLVSSILIFTLYGLFNLQRREGFMN